MYCYIFTFPSFYRSSQGYREQIMALINSFQVFEISTRGFRETWMKIRSRSCCSQLTLLQWTCSRIEKVSLFVHREFDDEISKMLTRGRNLKVYATSVVRKRLRIRIQEDVFMEEVHVKLASSPSPRRFQRDESFSGIRFYLPPHAKIPTYNSIHWEFTWHMVPISCCLIIVI